MQEQVIWLEHLRMDQVPEVGGKNASLGEMISGLSTSGVRVPSGFATTAHAYHEFLAQQGLERRISAELRGLDVNDIEALKQTGSRIRRWIEETAFQSSLQSALISAYRHLEMLNGGEVAVAVRSSATAEDLPDASFAGQQETFLNVRGMDALLLGVKRVFASLYNDRAIAYRVHKGFDHAQVALSAGIQKMVRSDIGAAGVIFTLDTESGFRDVVFVTASYGLGEMVVQGAVNPDEFYVFKPNIEAGRHTILSRHLGSKAIKMVYGEYPSEPVVRQEVPITERSRFCISDAQVEELGRYALAIEAHYGRPMDIEWALDGLDGQLYILQARPETVESRRQAGQQESYRLLEAGRVLVEGRSIGRRIGTGPARVIDSVAQMNRVEAGDVLITDMTDPDWEPVMKKAAAIVTNRGGRTCHAAIIARELGIPAVVGCGDATARVDDGRAVTVCCAEGETGRVYDGVLAFELIRSSGGELQPLSTKIMMNVANPTRAFALSNIPNEGIGLARLEFIINTMIGIHPKALLEFERQAPEIKTGILERMAGYHDPVSFYVEKLAEGISTLAAAFYPKPVIVRMSDFKSNEYGNLLGGGQYEPSEENPMLGFRGASRYVSDDFRPCFELECRAVKRVREVMGLDNLEIMIPFVRTLKEAEQVSHLLAANGLKRGDRGLRVIMMCEIPSNALLAEQFLRFFDGFSIGSNDLTQLSLGLDRDSGLVAESFDERDPAVKRLIGMAIKACRDQQKYVGICGQAPSDYPELAQWLLEQGISSISLNPDSVVETWRMLEGCKESRNH